MSPIRTRQLTPKVKGAISLRSSKSIFLSAAFVLTISLFICFPKEGLAFYRIGDQGNEVKEIQVRLREKGFELQAIDGFFGKDTQQAVKAFQEASGVFVDGIVGEETFQKLMERDLPANRALAFSNVRRIISSALSYQGIPYVFGGNTPRGFDCSGYTKYVFAQVGINLPRMADDQYYAVGRKVSRENLQPGDLVYFTTYTYGISHVGIYLGGGQFISATSSAGIAIRSMNDSYWGPRYMGANRVI